MFKAVFGSSAYRSLITRRRHRGEPAPGAELSSSSSDSDEGGAAAAPVLATTAASGAAPPGMSAGGELSGFDGDGPVLGDLYGGLEEYDPASGDGFGFGSNGGGGGGAGAALPAATTAADTSAQGSAPVPVPVGTVHRHGASGRVSFHGLERLLRQQLRGVHCLLVLDGCTGLVGQPWLPSMLEKLLRDAPSVHVLTTTVSPLGGLPSTCALAAPRGGG